MNILPRLIEAKLNTWTAAFSDDPSAQKRDDETYATLLASQNQFTDEEIGVYVGQLWNGEKTRADFGMPA